jgi:hypothetical protein
MLQRMGELEVGTAVWLDRRTPAPRRSVELTKAASPTEAEAEEASE